MITVRVWYRDGKHTVSKDVVLPGVPRVGEQVILPGDAGMHRVEKVLLYIEVRTVEVWC